MFRAGEREPGKYRAAELAAAVYEDGSRGRIRSQSQDIEATSVRFSPTLPMPPVVPRDRRAGRGLTCQRDSQTLRTLRACRDCTKEPLGTFDSPVCVLSMLAPCEHTS